MASVREGGCEAYLSKPISVGKFIETIQRFLENRAKAIETGEGPLMRIDHLKLSSRPPKAVVKPTPSAVASPARWK